METPDRPPAPPRPLWKRLLPLALLVVAAAAFYLSGAYRHASLDTLQERWGDLRALVAEYPLRSAAAFALFYAIAVAISVPGALWFTIAAGALFGWSTGTLVAWAGATSGATLIFLAVRSAAGGQWARGLFGARAQGMLEHFQRGLQAREFLYLVLTRIVPLPFFLVNVVSALAGARLPLYVAATALGIIPGTLAYATLGDSVGDALAMGGSINTSLASVIRDPKVYGAFALVLALTAIAHFGRQWQARLERKSS